MLSQSHAHLAQGRGMLTIRIYHGEDLPQKPPSLFEEVSALHCVSQPVQEVHLNPYCVVSFAGHEGKTAAQEHERHPTWNKQINLRVRVS